LSLFELQVNKDTIETLVLLVVKELIKWVVCIAHNSACIEIPHTTIMPAILLAWKLHVHAPGMGNLDIIKLLLSDIISKNFLAIAREN